jgi:hypothetical protein
MTHKAAIQQEGHPVNIYATNVKQWSTENKCAEKKREIVEPCTYKT